jgi:mannose-6-phosphate isomerase-like protein (cupin superfamily)
MADGTARPTKVRPDDVAWIGAEDAPTKVRIRRVITRERHGSDLLLGVCEMAPGDRTNRWSSTEENDAGPGDHWYGPVDETYYCLAGHLTLRWDEGEIDFGPGDAVYLAPGWHYTLENTGGETAHFVYHMTPSPE